MRKWVGSRKCQNGKIHKEKEEKKRQGCLITCYCPLMSLQVFIWSINNTKMLTVTSVCVCRLCVCPFMLFPIIQGVNGSLWEQRMRPLPSISLIKSKLLSLTLSLSRSLSFLRVKRMICHYQSTRASLLVTRFYISVIMAGPWDFVNCLHYLVGIIVYCFKWGFGYLH